MHMQLKRVQTPPLNTITHPHTPGVSPGTSQRHLSFKEDSVPTVPLDKLDLLCTTRAPTLVSVGSTPCVSNPSDPWAPDWCTHCHLFSRLLQGHLFQSTL